MKIVCQSCGKKYDTEKDEAITRLTAERVHRAERTKRKNKAEIATMILHGKNGRE